MHRIIKITLAATVVLGIVAAQTSGTGNAEFEAASIHRNPPRTGFHMNAESATGGPGTADPVVYRCMECSLGSLIAQAFEVPNYQFPGKSSLPENTFNVTAGVRAGATHAEFLAMLQGLLKDRFALSSHYTAKTMRGYQLTVSEKGLKLRESAEAVAAAPPGRSGFGRGESHSHSGVMSFHGNASFRRDHVTTSDLARLISDQLTLPVEDQTGLTGKYDISLSWVNSVSTAGDHADGAWGGGHGDHGGALGNTPAAVESGSGPTLFEALQAQLGLKLVPSRQTSTRILVIDGFKPLPTEN